MGYRDVIVEYGYTVGRKAEDDELPVYSAHFNELFEGDKGQVLDDIRKQVAALEGVSKSGWRRFKLRLSVEGEVGHPTSGMFHEFLLGADEAWPKLVQAVLSRFKQVEAVAKVSHMSIIFCQPKEQERSDKEDPMNLAQMRKQVEADLAKKHAHDGRYDDEENPNVEPEANEVREVEGGTEPDRGVPGDRAGVDFDRPGDCASPLGSARTAGDPPVCGTAPEGTAEGQPDLDSPGDVVEDRDPGTGGVGTRQVDLPIRADAAVPTATYLDIDPSEPVHLLAARLGLSIPVALELRQREAEKRRAHPVA